MLAFHVCAFDGQVRVQYSAIALSSCDAAMYAFELFDDEPCKVNVTPLTVAQ
jgi:hypothetical protein